MEQANQPPNRPEREGTRRPTEHRPYNPISAHHSNPEQASDEALRINQLKRELADSTYSNTELYGGTMETVVTGHDKQTHEPITKSVFVQNITRIINNIEDRRKEEIRSITQELEGYLHVNEDNIIRSDKRKRADKLRDSFFAKSAYSELIESQLETGKPSIKLLRFYETYPELFTEEAEEFLTDISKRIKKTNRIYDKKIDNLGKNSRIDKLKQWVTDKLEGWIEKGDKVWDERMVGGLRKWVGRRGERKEEKIEKRSMKIEEKRRQKAEKEQRKGAREEAKNSSIQTNSTETDDDDE